MDDLANLWKHVESQFLLGSWSIHGPSHWRRVENHGLLLARETSGADELVVRLFAVLHDSRRHDEGTDWGHGERGAELARLLRGEYFELDDHRLRILCEACARHEKGGVSDHPTTGTLLGRRSAGPRPHRRAAGAGVHEHERGPADGAGGAIVRQPSARARQRSRLVILRYPDGSSPDREGPYVPD